MEGRDQPGGLTSAMAAERAASGLPEGRGG